MELNYKTRLIVTPLKRSTYAYLTILTGSPLLIKWIAENQKCKVTSRAAPLSSILGKAAWDGFEFESFLFGALSTLLESNADKSTNLFIMLPPGRQLHSDGYRLA